MKDRLAYYAARLATGAFGLLPEPVMRRLGYGVGYLASYYLPEKMAMAERHMRRVLGPGADATRAARRMFGWYGRYWAEVFWLRPRRAAAMLGHIDVTGWTAVNTALAKGNGVIFALPHLGNWELGGARARAEGVPILAVAEALANERLVEWFIGIRRRLGIDVVIASEGSKVTRVLIEHLRRGGAVGLVCDRDLSGRGVTVEFFGEETTMPAGPLALADRTGAQVLPMATYFRDGPGLHMVIHDRVEIPDLPGRDERVARGTQALAAKFEEMISAAPPQWHLLVPNWPSDREAAS